MNMDNIRPASIRGRAQRFSNIHASEWESILRGNGDPDIRLQAARSLGWEVIVTGKYATAVNPLDPCDRVDITNTNAVHSFYLFF